MSAQNTLLTAVKATERGAFEYLPKPFDLNRPGRGRAARAVRAEPERSPTTTADDEQLPIVGRSPAMQDIYRALGRV